MSDNISLGELAKEMAALIAKELVGLKSEAPVIVDREVRQLMVRLEVCAIDYHRGFATHGKADADLLSPLHAAREELRAFVGRLTLARERAEVLLGKAEQECASLQVLPRLSRDYFHATYNGGYHEREEGDGRESQRQAFHHGMDCVFNAIERNTPE